jgi:prepilin-type processing-associated H-X9-DG protein
MAYLLPYIEQENVYKELYNFNPPGGLAPGALFQLDTTCPSWAYGFGPFDFQDPSVPVSQWHGTGGGYPKAANTKIKTYLCPADPGGGNTLQGSWVLDATVCHTRPPFGWYWAWDWVQPVPGYGAEMGLCNYLGVAGANGLTYPANPSFARWGRYIGIYYDNSQTRIAEITDGTSNTLAFGEYLGGLYIDGSRYGVQTWLGAGQLPTKWGLQPIYGPGGNDYYNLMFQSKHTGGIVNFAFADGSVHGISQTVDFNVFIYASGMHDGMAFNESDLYP